LAWQSLLYRKQASCSSFHHLRNQIEVGGQNAAPKKMAVSYTDSI